MRITAIVERGSDGLYSIYTQDTIGRDVPGGYGDSVEAAKQDFLARIKESIENANKDGFDNVPVFEAVSVEFKFDIPSFFNYFDFINVSKFASYAGVNESKMRAYKSGSAFPGEKTTRKILKAVQTIGREMCATRF